MVLNFTLLKVNNMENINQVLQSLVGKDVSKGVMEGGVWINYPPDPNDPKGYSTYKVDRVTPSLVILSTTRLFFSDKRGLTIYIPIDKIVWIYIR
jgi:hypothetical protein